MAIKTYKNTFAQEIEAFVSGVIEKEKTLVSRVRYRVGEVIIERTPVRTGRARGAWRGSGGSPSDEIGVSKDKSGEDTKRKLWQSANQVPIGTTFYFVNNVHYVYYLEYLHTSQQAPQGMVRITVQEFQQAVREVLSEL